MSTGPGHTRWEENDAGGVDRIQWNDPAWRTRWIHPHEITARNLPRLLRRAYETGMADQRKIIEDALKGRIP